MPVCQNRRASACMNSSKSCWLNGLIVGTPVLPELVAMYTTSSSGTQHSSPKKLPTPWQSRSVCLLMNGNFSRSLSDVM